MYIVLLLFASIYFFFQAEDGIRFFCLSRGLGYVYNRQVADRALAERRFIASFVNGESLDEMLASFNADEAMRIRREGRIVNITKR